MTWFGWFLVIWFVFGAVVTVLTIEKQPIKRTTFAALFTLTANAAIIIGILSVGTGHR